MTNNTRKLGKFWMWLTTRVSLLLVLIFILVMLGPLEPLFKGLVFLPILFLVVILEWQYPVAYGYADTNGIRFRRYFRRHSASWKEVKSIEWRSLGSGFMLFLEPAPGRPRKIGFLLDRASLWGKSGPSRSRNLPEIISWIREQTETSSSSRQ